MALRVLFPVGYLYPAQNGGPALTLYRVGRALKASEDLELSFIASGLYTGGKVKLDEWIDSDFGKVKYVKCKSPSRSIKFLLEVLRSLVIQDVIIVTSVFALNNLFFLIASAVLSKKVILAPRGELDDGALRFKPLKKKIYLGIYRRIILFVKPKLLVTCEQEFVQANKNLGICLERYIIPNFLPVELLSDEKKSVRGITYIGRISPKKNIEFLLQIVQYKSENNDPITLDIYGDDSNAYADFLKGKICDYGIKDYVFFHGHVEDDKKRAAFKRAYMLVLPSFSENFGNVVIEALMQGTPVIASANTPWSVLNDEKLGFHLPLELNKFVEAVDELHLMDLQSYKELCERCRQYVIKEFNEDKFKSLWTEMLMNYD